MGEHFQQYLKRWWLDAYHPVANISCILKIKTTNRNWVQMTHIETMYLKGMNKWLKEFGYFSIKLGIELENRIWSRTFIWDNWREVFTFLEKWFRKYNFRTKYLCKMAMNGWELLVFIKEQKLGKKFRFEGTNLALQIIIEQFVLHKKTLVSKDLHSVYSLRFLMVLVWLYILHNYCKYCDKKNFYIDICTYFLQF